MFTDVSGFTSLSERLDPEEVHALMDRAFEVILAAVHGYEGTINQFLGDGVMALFGAPIAHEDHAGRALRAALAIQEKLAPIRADVQQRYGRDFLMRIGINTGLVVVGAIGRDLRMDYTALGDTVNLASRLLNVAQPGQIVASRHTKELCEGFFVFEDLGDFQVKGKTEPQRAYAVKGELGGRTRLEVSKERGLTPLIGRAVERERLAEVFRKAAGGRGGVVVLAGEPGVGKSAPPLRILTAAAWTAAGTWSSKRPARPSVAPWRIVRWSSCTGDTSISRRVSRRRTSGEELPRGSSRSASRARSLRSCFTTSWASRCRRSSSCACRAPSSAAARTRSWPPSSSVRAR